MNQLQIWQCGVCGTKRGYGNAPRPDNKKVLLVCEGSCNYGRHRPVHTIHRWIESKPIGRCVEVACSL
jgi:hypothetical protein